MQLTEFKQTLLPGDCLFREGDAGDVTYFVEQGDFSVSTETAGPNRVVAIIGAGEIIGEITLLNQSPRSATVICRRTATVIAIDRRLLVTEVDAANPLLKLLVDGLLARLANAARQLQLQPDSEASANSIPAEASFHQGSRKILGAGALADVKLRHALQGALQNNEFELYWQPVQSFSCGEIAGFEIAVRWQHPELGLLTPADFMGLAEESGDSAAIGRWAIAQALDDLHKLQQWVEPEQPLFVSLPLSSVQLSDAELLPLISASLAELSLTAEQLRLNLSEAVLVGQADEAVQRLTALSSLGVQLAVDQFGRGTSSLNLLQKYPLSAIKIAASVVLESGNGDVAEKMVKGIVQLGHAFELTVIADGVADAESANALQAMGCDFGLGYYFGRSLAFTELPELFANPVEMPAQTSVAALKLVHSA